VVVNPSAEKCADMYSHTHTHIDKYRTVQSVLSPQTQEIFKFCQTNTDVMSIHIYTLICIRMYISMYVYVCVCVFTHMHLKVCSGYFHHRPANTSVQRKQHVDTNTYTDTRTHTHTHTHTQTQTHTPTHR